MVFLWDMTTTQYHKTAVKWAYKPYGTKLFQRHIIWYISYILHRYGALHVYVHNTICTYWMYHMICWLKISYHMLIWKIYRCVATARSMDSTWRYLSFSLTPIYTIENYCGLVVIWRLLYHMIHMHQNYHHIIMLNHAIHTFDNIHR